MVQRVAGLAVAVGIWVPAAAQSLTDRISAVDRAQQEETIHVRAAAQAAQAAQDRDYEAARAKAASSERAHATQAAFAERARAARAAGAARAAAAAKTRNDTFEDRLRDLEVQREQTEIEAEQAEVAALKARAARANDYIDRDLKKQDAEADLTASEADANRNISLGAKSALESEGQAEVKKESEFFPK
jgi:hypothetical protein